MDKIRKSAWEEFEIAWDESDSVIILQMILTSWESMNKLRDKMIVKYDQINRNIDKGTFKFKENW